MTIRKLEQSNVNCTNIHSSMANGLDLTLTQMSCQFGNAIVLSWIMNSVSKEIFSGIVYSTDATIVCNDLKERFDKINGSRIFSLHCEIGRLIQGIDFLSQSTIPNCDNYGMSLHLL